MRRHCCLLIDCLMVGLCCSWFVVCCLSFVFRCLLFVVVWSFVVACDCVLLREDICCYVRHVARFVLLVVLVFGACWLLLVVGCCVLRCCVLFVVHWSLFNVQVCCPLSAIRGSLFVVCQFVRLLFVVCCLLLVVWFVCSFICYGLFVVCYLLRVV